MVIPTGSSDTLAVEARELRPGVAEWPEGWPEGWGAGCLWVAGRVPGRPRVAIVGSRRPDGSGLRAARELAEGLAARGVAVVSGGAVGIDAAAHEGALSVGGTTVAVLGSGLARPYPREHGALFRRIAATGAVVSPFPPGTEPLPGNFVRRNRLLAALADLVVVVRAGERSGALSTARWAIRLGRGLAAVPGSPGSESTAGSNDLLRRGAPAVLEADDVLARLGTGAPTLAARGPVPSRPSRDRSVPAAAAGPAEGDGDPVWAWLAGGEAASAERLQRLSGEDPRRLAIRLGTWEAEGRLVRTGDGRYRLGDLGGG